MSKSRRIGILMLAIAGIVIVGWLARESKHFMHNWSVEREGKLRAEAVKLSVDKVVDGMAFCSVVIKNTGNQSWTQDQNYFALGVFERNIARSRVEKIKFVDGTNRFVIHKDIAPGESWEANFQVTLPKRGAATLHFQMVQEGVTWFGQEKTVEIIIRGTGPPADPAGGLSMLLTIII